MPDPFVQVLLPERPGSALDRPDAVHAALVVLGQGADTIPELYDGPPFQSRAMVSHELFPGDIQVIHDPGHFFLGYINVGIITVRTTAIAALDAGEF